MKLNHIDLQVEDVQETVRFFEDFFDFEMRTSRNSPALAILDDRHGLVMVLQKKKRTEEIYPEGFHIGFLVERDEDVVAFSSRAEAQGLRTSPIERNSRGTMTYCRAPGGIVVEV
ncbi:MAG: VOC family protein, partial [Polyangiales bacterium]